MYVGKYIYMYVMTNDEKEAHEFGWDQREEYG